jgi:hypothetical protein
MIRFLVHHIEALERDRDICVERDPQCCVCSGEVDGVAAEPVNPCSVTFSLVPRERFIDRRQRANTHISGRDHRPGTSLAVAGDPSIPHFRESHTSTLVLRQAPSRGPFLTPKDEFDELVSQFDTIAKACNVGGTFRVLFPDRCEIALPERCGSGPVQLW